MKHIMKVYVMTAVLLLVSGGYVFGELSPLVYQQMQQDAQEYYIIRITRVRTPFRLFSRDKPVIASAAVQQVIRSQRSAVPGEIIEIRYESYAPPRGWVGPRPVPILNRGSSYHAFLSWSEANGYFTPAARGASFDPPIEFD